MSCLEEAQAALPTCQQGEPATVAFDWPPLPDEQPKPGKHERLQVLRGDYVLWEQQWPSRVQSGQQHTHPTACLSRFVDSTQELSQFFSRKMGGRLKLEPRGQGMLSCFPGRPTDGRWHAAQQKPHIDSLEDERRVMTAEFYFTPRWDAQRDGGLIRMQLQGKKAAEGQTYEVEPKSNRLVLFLSEIVPHQVLSTASASNRYAVTFWISVQNP
eukprot:gb/GEZN01003369.1/.p1 GENE.gb/GEZN01003369.1/~~gb/GEZN01003369.1/.p1  ORF type:complete len:213 (-),score=33.74 gb/GEZN01003369.1/:1283-1921(-)